ncbi:MAG: hypothetical protein N2170_07810 [Bacteroidia bacterium]|nr:hypothetical protein [Bacteroidia bacterium]
MRVQLISGLALLIIGILGRLLPHPPNFTPVDAVALFSGAWLTSRWLGFVLPLVLMAGTDIWLGWHDLWPFTWGATLMGVLIGRYFLRWIQWREVAALSVLQATLFFLLTNLGVWMTGAYGYTWEGLALCYGAAIPFYHYQVLGALLYSTLFWAVGRFAIRFFFRESPAFSPE